MESQTNKLCHSQNQKSLPFAESATERNERRKQLGAALCLVGSRCNCHLSRLFQIIYDNTYGGHGEYRTCFEVLASRPWHLCCSISTAHRTVIEAVNLGLIHAPVRADSVDEAVSTVNYFSRSPKTILIFRIHWENIWKMIGFKESMPLLEGCAQNDTDQYQSDTDRCQSATDLRQFATEKTSSHLKELRHVMSCHVKNVDVDDISWEEADNFAGEIAVGIYRVPAPKIKPEAWEFLVTVAAMADCVFCSREWVLGAIASTAKNAEGDKIGYFRSTLSNRLSEFLGLCKAKETRELFGRVWAQLRGPAHAYVVAHPLEVPEQAIDSPKETVQAVRLTPDLQAKTHTMIHDLRRFVRTGILPTNGENQ